MSCCAHFLQLRLPTALILLSASACTRGLPSPVAQAPAVATVNARIATLQPGSPELVLGHLGDLRQDFQVMMRRAQDSTYRSMARSVSIDQPASDPTRIDLLSRFEMRGGSADTLTVSRSSFAPVTERLHAGILHFVIDYDGRRVHGTRQVRDSLPRAFDLSFPETPFAFNQLGALVRSLRWDAGYQRVVPMYSEMDMKVEYDTVLVVAREPRDRGDVWRVRFADPVLVIMFTIDAATRRLLGQEVTPRSGAFSMRYESTAPTGVPAQTQ